MYSGNRLRSKSSNCEVPIFVEVWVPLVAAQRPSWQARQSYNHSAIEFRVCESPLGVVWALVGGVDCVGGFEEGLDVGGDGLQAHEGFLYFRT